MIFLDNNATTAVTAEVREAVVRVMTEFPGNPSSIHQAGRDARDLVEDAREQVAALIGARSRQVFFTSGATESINTVLRQVPRGGHVVTSTVEHAAVLDPLDVLAEERALRITRIPVNREGALNLDALQGALDSSPDLVSLIWANNETGVIFPVEEIVGMCRQGKVRLHLDACQAVGKIPVDVARVKADYVSFSGHKFHGPKGVGGLYLRRGAPFAPLIVGGGQENERRSGTENVPGIVGLGVAAEQAAAALEGDAWSTVQDLRDTLERGLLAIAPGACVQGARQERLPNTCNIGFAHCSGEAMLQLLDEHGVFVSTSSACSSNETEPSHVLGAMQLPETHIHGVLRFSLSRFTTPDDIAFVLEQMPKVIELGRAASTASA